MTFFRFSFEGSEIQFPSKNRTPKINKLGKDLAEVFRTDFITAMKVPDSQPLPAGKMIMLKDTWRQEWEKGVQVCILHFRKSHCSNYESFSFMQIIFVLI